MPPCTPPRRGGAPSPPTGPPVASRWRHTTSLVAADGEQPVRTLEEATGAATAITDILAEAGVPGLVVDLGPLEFIDSAGVQVLLSGKRLADDRGIGFRVANPCGKVLRVLTILNLDRLLRYSSAGHNS